MAAVAKRLGFYARVSRPLRIAQRCQQNEFQAPWQQQRFFSATPSSLAKKGEEDEAEVQDTVDHEFEHLKEVFRDEGEDIPNKASALNEILVDVDPSELQGYVEPRPRRAPDGFWAEGEPDMGEDEEWHGDDITSTGHGELEQQREIREYMRIAAWELPLLAKYAKPFEPPTAQTPLRFRYTTYMGEQHPAARKVVVEFSINDIPDLTQVQKDKLIKLAGPRYNPSTQSIKMSAENFDTQAQNKRYLGDTINSLIKEARDGADTFADVPFDFRHHKPKVFHRFPEEWILTPERKKLLDQRREERRLIDEKKIREGTLVNGAAIIEDALSTPIFEKKPEPVMITRGTAQTRRPGRPTLGAKQ